MPSLSLNFHKYKLDLWKAESSENAKIFAKENSKLLQELLFWSDAAGPEVI